eukprot:g46515.t1
MHNCVAKFNSNSIHKFADNTTVVGRISNNDETEYRKGIDSFLAWRKANNLSLNVSKVKELVINFRKQSRGHASIFISGVEAEVFDSFKFLGITIINNLSWPIYMYATVKKAHQHFYFLR